MRSDIIITKASGKKEPFEKSKLYQSMLRSGASATLANQIVQTIEIDLTEGMSTKSIYKMAHNLLSKAERPVAGRYHLKNGIMELGPSGFPFEKYVSEILAHQGYTVQVGKMVDGKCVKHEVDIIAEKGEQHFMIECKYHNSPGIYCDVKIPLYIHSRFKDIESQWMIMPGHGAKFHQGWVVTNTRFRTDAITYGSCAGLKLISLDFPMKGSLREMIEETGLLRQRMYKLLALYARPLAKKYPVVCMDEKSKQLMQDVRGVIPLKPGSPAKYDGEYCRKGTRNIFVAVEPLAGKRKIKVTRQRKKSDFAHFIKELVTHDYVRANKIQLVLDNLNIHFASSFYETFSKKEADQLLRKIEFYYTPKHGSWLNMAEIEINMMDRECLNRRIGEGELLEKEVNCWTQQRNKVSKKIDWSFTRKQADKKLSKYYVA